MGSSTSHPLLNVALVREEDLHHLLLTPGLVLVGPGFPPLPLEVRQKRLLLGHMRGMSNLVNDGPVDLRHADCRESRNFLPKLVHSHPRVVEQPPIDGSKSSY